MSKFAFTVPIADATTALVKRKDDTALSDPAGIAGKVVGSQAGSAQLKALQDYAKKLQAEGKPPVTIREYVSFDEAMPTWPPGVCRRWRSPWPTWPRW